MKAYKGFNKDMTCRGFKYEEGKEYETDKAEICKSGFHACEYPLDVFGYYNPAESVFHIVEQDGEIDKDEKKEKTSSTKIRIGKELNISEMVKDAISFTKKRVKKEKISNGYYGASSNTGKYGESSNTGECGASSNTGDYGASSNAGKYGASSNTGYYGASSNTGDYGASSNTGDYGASSNTGKYGATVTTGYCSMAETMGEKSVAVAWGKDSQARGVNGSTLVIAEWEDWDIKSVITLKVGENGIKENTWYKNVNGKAVEVE